MSGITTHVLDTSRGRPAAGLGIVLESRGADGSFRRVGSGTTDADGRLRTLLSGDEPPAAGTWRLVFATGDWFRVEGIPAYFPEVTITFEVKAGSGPHHVPLLLSPFGYSTYRGS